MPEDPNKGHKLNVFHLYSHLHQHSSNVLSGLIVALLCCTFGSEARAQGTFFCDPEDPTCEQPSPSDAPSKGASDAELFCDPEDPTCEEPSGDNVDTMSKPSMIERAFGDTTPPSSTTASFKGTYATSLAIDTGFDGPQEDVFLWSTGMNFDVSYDPTPSFRVVAQAQFRHWWAGRENQDSVDVLFNADDPRAGFDVLMGPTYVLWRADRWSIRVGNTLTSWGSTDLTRPGDIINPRDYRSIALRAPGAFEDRLTQFTVDANWIGKGWNAQLVMVPFFVPDRLPLSGRDVDVASLSARAFGGRGVLTARAVSLLNGFFSTQDEPVLSTPFSGPDASPQNVSFGARVSATWMNTDVGLGHYVGWDRTPWLDVDPDARALLRLGGQDAQLLRDGNVVQFLERNPEAASSLAGLQARVQRGEPIAQTEFLRQNTLVLDLARYIGPIGVRADVAWTFAKVFLSEDLDTLRRPSLDAALGLSYELLSGFNQWAFVLEGFANKPLGATNVLTRAFVSPEKRGQPNATPLLVEDGLYGVGTGLNWTHTEWGIQAQLGGIYTVSTGGFVGNAQVSKRWNSWSRLSIGGALYEGPDPEDRLSLGGLLDLQDSVYVGFDGAF